MSGNLAHLAPERTLLDDALAYAADGWPVVAVWSVRDGVCLCPDGPACPDSQVGKHPCFDPELLPNGTKSATRDPAVIRRWFERWPDANVGGVIPAGLAVVDLDPRNQNEEAAGWLRVHLPLLPPTQTHATGGGGEHRVFVTSAPLRSARALAPGVELLGAGHLLILPPSAHKSGRTYTVADNRSPAPLPAFVIEQAGTGVVIAVRPRAAASGGLPAWLPDHIGVGARYVTIQRLAGWLRGCGMSGGEILAELRQVAATRVEQPPHDVFTDGQLIERATWAGTLPTSPTPVRLHERFAPIMATWVGRNTGTDRRVFEAVLGFMRLRKAVEVELAERTIALMARMQEQAVRRALHRLHHDRGVLDLIAPHVAGSDRAAVYRLVHPERMAEKFPEHRNTYGEEWSYVLRCPGNLPAEARDLFRKNVLGLLAEPVYEVLRADGGQWLTDIAHRVARPRPGVLKALRRMETHDLAAEADDGWRRGPADPVAVAKKLGVYGKTVRQKTRYAQERARWRSPEAKAQRERNAAERKRLQVEVTTMAARSTFPACGGVEAGAEAWTRFIRRATRKQLVGALVALRERGRGTVVVLKVPPREQSAPVRRVVGQVAA